jgi:hypothetical protein
MCVGTADTMSGMAWLTMDVVIESGFVIAGGALATLYGYGVLDLKPAQPQPSDRTRKALRFWRWCGPLLICFGGFLLLEAYVR